MKKVVRAVRDAGATEVHLLISCPPLISPCFMGVDFSTYRELAAANGATVERICAGIGADSLNYMTVAGLVECIGMPEEALCTACVTGEYPLKKKPEILE
jgi:amidophosphoribosyltransferase